MDDKKIVELYFDRSEAAIKYTEEKYGKYLRCISYGILGSHEDTEECLNDTLHAAWSSIPPKSPENLGTYLGRIIRNLSLNRYAAKNTQKRRNETDVIFEEAAEFVPDPASGFSLADELVLKEAVNSFLSTLPEVTRNVFMRRYWYFSPISEIAIDYGMTTANVKITLHRTRKKFKKHLEKEGIII